MKKATAILGTLLLAATAYAEAPAKELSLLVNQLPKSGVARIAYDIHAKSYTVSFGDTQTVPYTLEGEQIGEFVSSKPAPSICMYTNKKGTLIEEICLNTPLPVYANSKKFLAPDGTEGCTAKTSGGYALVLVGEKNSNVDVLKFTGDGTKIKKG